MPNWTKLGGARQDFSFLLFEPFSNHVLANVLEPLRAANDLLGREAYRWQFVTPDGAAVKSSSGMEVRPHARLGDEAGGDMLVILPSYGYRRWATAEMGRALRAASERYLWMAGVDCGAWLLAAAGLLEHYRATIHFDEFDRFAERFPDTNAQRERWILDEDRITAGGAVPGFELMLHLIGETHGTALTLEIAALFMSGSGGPRASLVARDPLVARTVELMHAHIERPWSIPAIAAVVGVTQVQLDRHFRAGLGASPQAVYRKLRLDMAKRLVVETELSMAEIGLRVGFQNQASFTRAFRHAYGAPPGQWRLQGEGAARG